MILTATTQQKLGAATVVVLIVGWLGFILAHLRSGDRPAPGAEIELAPNRRPYFDDDGLEGPRLTRALLSALVLIVIVAVGLPLYWAREPSRQAGALEGFDKRAVHRGFLLFQPADSPVPAGNVGHFGCGGCHGTSGEGGVATYSLADPVDPTKPPRQVQWRAPELDTVALRYNDDQLRAVLVYGRANTPMPPWGVLGGGPMNDQQISDLIAYLHSIARDSKKVQKASLKKYGTDGAAIFEGMCSRCHTKGWSYGESELVGGGAFGPNLTNGDTLRQFPDLDTHIEYVGEGVPYGKSYGTRGVNGNEGGGMPAFGQMLTKEQIRAVVEYERTL